MASSANNHRNANGLEALADVFKCYICLEKLNNARMCPHCSKLCCHDCIMRWITENRAHCPHCRTPLHAYSLVNCRWADEVNQQIDHLQGLNLSSASGTSQSSSSNNDLCETHGERLTVFCTNCDRAVCHRCALFDGRHGQHSFRPLEEIYNEQVDLIKAELDRIKQRRLEVGGIVQSVERNIASVRQAKDTQMAEIRKVVDAITSRLDANLTSKMSILTSQRNHLSQEVECLDRVLREFRTLINTSSPASLITRIPNFNRMFTAIHRNPVSSLVSEPVAPNFESEIVPEFDTGTFLVENYSMMRHRVDPVYSQPIHVYGLTWRLKVYPDGNGVVRGNYLSVFLELCAGSTSPTRYEYIIELVHQGSPRHGRKNVLRRFQSEFEVNECWGYNRFIRLDQLIAEDYYNGEEDSILFKFHVRAPTFHQKCLDLQSYIAKMEANGGRGWSQCVPHPPGFPVSGLEAAGPSFISGIQDAPTPDPSGVGMGAAALASFSVSPASFGGDQPEYLRRPSSHQPRRTDASNLTSILPELHASAPVTPSPDEAYESVDGNHGNRQHAPADCHEDEEEDDDDIGSDDLDIGAELVENFGLDEEDDDVGATDSDAAPSGDEEEEEEDGRTEGDRRSFRTQMSGNVSGSEEDDVRVIVDQAHQHPHDLTPVASQTNGNNNAAVLPQITNQLPHHRPRLPHFSEQSPFASLSVDGSMRTGTTLDSVDLMLLDLASSGDVEDGEQEDEGEDDEEEDGETAEDEVVEEEVTLEGEGERDHGLRETASRSSQANENDVDDVTEMRSLGDHDVMESTSAHPSVLSNLLGPSSVPPAAASLQWHRCIWDRPRNSTLRLPMDEQAPQPALSVHHPANSNHDNFAEPSRLPSSNAVSAAPSRLTESSTPLEITLNHISFYNRETLLTPTGGPVFESFADVLRFVRRHSDDLFKG